jgi:death on curing protein
MPEVEYLTPTDVVALAELFFAERGYARPVLRADGRALLDAAVHRARTSAFYGEADLAQQAAVLCAGIVANHAFVDGNERAAWIACLTFLAINGLDLSDADSVSLAAYMIELLEAEQSAMDNQLADWLRAHLS